MPDDDEELWGLITKDVRPITREKSLAPQQDKQKFSPKEIKEQRASMPVRASIAPVQPAKAFLGRDIDRNTAEKLRKGQIPIEARLDLHGMNQIEAQGALRDFIHRSCAAGKRCVLVITGKGVGVDGRRDPLSGGQGVLKQKTPEWLNEGDLRSLVLKTQQAQRKHGGDGALYVFLRLQR